MRRTMITFMMALAAVALLAIGAANATARQGADDPAGHVRHGQADDTVKARHKNKCARARHHHHASSTKRARHCKKTHPATRDDKGGRRAAGVSDDPANHDAGDDRGGRGRGSDDA